MVNEGLCMTTEDRIREYQIKKVRHYPADSASRHALAGLLDDAQAVVPETTPAGDEAVGKAMLRLVATWRARLNVLRTLGWQRAAGPHMFYCANCPPVGVHTFETTAHTCKDSQVCPFCWCRSNVYDTYERLRFAYYGHMPIPKPRAEQVDPDERESVLPMALDLLEITTWVHLDHGKVTIPSLLKDNITDTRANFIRRLNPFGAFQLYTVEPSDPRMKQPYWTFKQRILAVVEVGSPDPPQINRSYAPRGMAVGDDACGRYFKRHTGVTEYILAGAVGRIAAYPSQMMRGSKQDTVDLLNYINGYGGTRRCKEGVAKSGFRLSGYYGILRNKRQRMLERRMGMGIS